MTNSQGSNKGHGRLWWVAVIIGIALVALFAIDSLTKGVDSPARPASMSADVVVFGEWAA